MASVLAINGSLRTGSYHGVILNDIGGRLSSLGHTYSIAQISDLPLYNPDLEGKENEAVTRLGDDIVQADVVIMATPEYNHSVAAPLKNAIEWASRPAYKGPLTGKKVATISASPGMIGGARAQAHLKLILMGMSAEVFPYPEVALGHIHQSVTDGNITGEAVNNILEKYTRALSEWI